MTDAEPRLKDGWDMPLAPKCPCDHPMQPVACFDGGVELFFECDHCCEVSLIEIPWPFTNQNVNEDDFEELGFRIE